MFSHQAFSPLLDWFYETRSPHFFRENRTPYTVWISEVTLQQTRIQAALVPLKRFLTRFPDLEALAEASLEDVLLAFKGLGYYSRAKNLHKGAQFIQENLDGQIPTEYEELLKIPSIGPYTAAAIASICFAQKIPVVDGNVKRVCSRIFAWKLELKSPELYQKTEKALQKNFLRSSDSPGDINEALMELGQKVCKRTNPDCAVCPLQKYCKAYQSGKVSLYPAKSPKAEKILVDWNIYLIEDESSNFFLQQWKDFYFLKGQTSFPSILHFPASNQQISSIQNFEILDSVKTLTPFRHGITKHKITVKPYYLKMSRWHGADGIWLSEQQIAEKLVPSVLSKVWQRYLKEKNQGQQLDFFETDNF